MGDEDKRLLLEKIRETLTSDEEFSIEMIVLNPVAEEPGIWLEIEGNYGYLGKSFRAAMFTASIGDWIVPSHQGALIEDDVEWFERRAMLGPNWSQKEPRMMYQERRTRIVQNVMEYGCDPDETIPSLIEAQQANPDLFLETQEIEIVQVADWPGYWRLSEDRTYFHQVSINVDHDSYQIVFGEFRDFVHSIAWKKVASFTTTDDDKFVNLKIYGDDQEQPLVVITKDEETGQMNTQARLQ